MSEPREKRRRVYLGRAFQRRVIAWVVGFLLVAGAISGAVLYLLLSSSLESDLWAAHVQIHDTWQRAGWAVLVGNLCSVVTVGTAAAIIALYASHRIAGPMFRFERILEAIGRGDFEPSATLRSGDQLASLADAIAETLRRLRVRNGQQRALLVEAASLVYHLQTAADEERDVFASALYDTLKALDQTLAPNPRDMPAQQ